MRVSLIITPLFRCNIWIPNTVQVSPDMMIMMMRICHWNQRRKFVKFSLESHKFIRFLSWLQIGMDSQWACPPGLLVNITGWTNYILSGWNLYKPKEHLNIQKEVGGHKNRTTCLWFASVHLSLSTTTSLSTVLSCETCYCGRRGWRIATSFPNLLLQDGNNTQSLSLLLLRSCGVEFE